MKERPETEIQEAIVVSYESVFRAEFQAIVSDVFRILNDHDGALDVAEEAFTRLAQHWHKVGRYERPGAWVRRVAIRIAVRNRFHRYREQPQVIEDSVSDAPFNELHYEVRRAVMELPRIQRATIVLYYFDDLLVEEVADTLGCRVGTAKANLHKARAQLRQKLAGVINNED